MSSQANSASKRREEEEEIERKNDLLFFCLFVCFVHIHKCPINCISKMQTFSIGHLKYATYNHKLRKAGLDRKMNLS